MSDKIEPGKKESGEKPEEPEHTGTLPQRPGGHKIEPGKQSDEKPEQPQLTRRLDDKGKSSPEKAEKSQLTGTLNDNKGRSSPDNPEAQAMLTGRLDIKGMSSPDKPKLTGILPSLDDDGGISSSRQLDFAIAVERVTDSYRNSDHLLMVYFPQRAEPFLFADTDAVLIGRSAGQNVDLDTTSFHGRELGVSRQHAEIVFENGAYYVRDLKSTNGTWLNTQRLAPLQRYPVEAGDQLRLGHCLMILFVRTEKA